METHQQKSFEVMVPVLEHGKFHFLSGRGSEINIFTTIGDVCKLVFTNMSFSSRAAAIWQRAIT